jgi:hypothetical protein
VDELEVELQAARQQDVRAALVAAESKLKQVSCWETFVGLTALNSRGLITEVSQYKKDCGVKTNCSW